MQSMLHIENVWNCKELFEYFPENFGTCEVAESPLSLLTVGLPAKSGTSGVIMVAVPNVMGLCVYSPLLDNHRNSVRGLQFCKVNASLAESSRMNHFHRMVEVYNFHHYDCSMKHGRQKEDPRHSRVEEKAEEVVGLLFSAASGDATAMRRYHLIGMDMELKDYDGRTALHLSAAEGHLECVDYLLNVCHVSPFARDRITVLMSPIVSCTGWKKTAAVGAQGKRAIDSALPRLRMESGIWICNTGILLPNKRHRSDDMTVSCELLETWGHTAKDDAKIFGHNDVAAMIEQAEKCKGHFMQKMENVSLKN
ncbi:unnamed protein product [Darwinula stevensoni]|uniref:glutaminase n=1 Tax=Darwinula stevensoni TaxID=69355 RepID=A0A7R8X3J7_9CRUS|nr:unnamed protein product [Darwinula stevensoni]CAG0882589.1 unnamed protein product [Darwinula stevensoni]